MGGACSIHMVEMRNAYKLWLENLKGRDYFGDYAHMRGYY
jgi:hypothetical protein